jgi:succinyl-diaminopimelate desuccinylase
VTDLKGRILEAVTSCRHEPLGFTKQLISTRTENPPGKSYHECTQIISAKLDEIGIDHRVIKVPEGVSTAGQPQGSGQDGYPRYCILGLYGRGKPVLYFHGHYDVVPGASDAQFEPVVAGERLIGRGSSDMKGGLAAMIYAIGAIKSCGIALNGRIGITIVPDEETGGNLGSQYLVRSGLLGKDAVGALTPEPTEGVIWNACRGAISLRLTVKGRHAHVGNHYEGINAFEQMLVAARRFVEIREEISSRLTDFKIEPEDAKRSILLMGGECSGGTSFNSVPERCSFTVDRRFNPEEDLEEEKARLLGVIDDLRKDGIDIDVKILQEGESAGAAEEDRVGKVLAESVEEITGKRPAFEMCPGLLETRFYSLKGIPAYGYGPGLLSVSHGPGEFVYLKDLYTCTVVYALAAVRLLA